MMCRALKGLFCTLRVGHTSTYLLSYTTCTTTTTVSSSTITTAATTTTTNTATTDTTTTTIYIQPSSTDSYHSIPDTDTTDQLR